MTGISSKWAGGFKRILMVLLISAMILTAITPISLSRAPIENSVMAPKTLDRNDEPVIILGSDVPGYSGYDVNNIFVWSYSGGWRQVVFQIDEANGTFIRKPPSTSSAGPHYNYYDGDDGLMDSDDEIVFMANETGDRINAGMWPPGADSGTPRYEITVTDTLTGETGWVYLYYHTTPPAWTSVDYVSWTEATNYLSAYGYSLNYYDDDSRQVFYTEMKISPNIGGDDFDIVDRNKRAVYLNTGIVPERAESGESRGLESYYSGLDDDPQVYHDYRIKDGPVRVLKHLRWGFGSANLFDLSDKMGWRTANEFQYYPTMYTEDEYIRSQSAADIMYYYRSIDHTSSAGPLTYYNSNAATGTVNGDAADDSVPTTLMTWDQISSPHGSYISTYDIGAFSNEANTPSIKTTRWIDDSADPDSDAGRGGAPGPDPEVGRYGEHGIDFTRGSPAIDPYWQYGRSYYNFYFFGANSPNVGEDYSNYSKTPLSVTDTPPLLQSWRDDVDPPATVAGTVLIAGLASYSTTVSTAGTVPLTGTVDETGHGDGNISSAVWTNGFANFPGTAMTASDGAFGTNISENVEQNINLAGWAAGTYEIYIYGTDEDANQNITSTEHAIITITDDLSPATQSASVLVDGLSSYVTQFSSAGPVDITATIDDTGRGSSTIISAVWTNGFANFPGTAMPASDGVFDYYLENVTFTLPLDTWDAGVYDLYVYGTDATPLQNTTSTERATVTITDDVEPEINNVMLEGMQVYNMPYSADAFLTLTATVNDSASGNSDIGGANFTVGAMNWASSLPMQPVTSLDSPVEDFSFLINVSGWQPGTYVFYVYGWDAAPNYVTSSTAFATLVITNNWAPEIRNVLVDGMPTVTVPYSGRTTVTLTATVDDTNHGNDTIAGANYTIGTTNWPSSTTMTPDTALDYYVENFTAIVDISGWGVGPYDLYVYGRDIQNDYNSSSLLFGRIIIYDDVPPQTQDVKINGLALYETDNSIAGSITLTASINDTATGNSVVGGANYTIGANKWATGANMTPDNNLDSPDESFSTVIDISSWPSGIYKFYVYGWDETPVYNTDSQVYATLVIHDIQTPEIQNVRINGSTTFNVNYASATTVELTATIDDTGRGDSEIGGANYTDGFINWPTSAPMSTYNDEALSDIPLNGIVWSDDYTAPDDYKNTGQLPDDDRYEHIQEALNAGVKTYDFKTYGAGDKQGFHRSVNNGNFNANDWDMGSGGSINTELTATQYGQIDTEDSSVWQYDTNGAKYWRYQIAVAEGENDITRIDAYWNADRVERTSSSPITLNIWNGASWVQLDSQSTGANNAPLTLQGSVTTNIIDYVDAAGYVYLGIYSKDPGGFFNPARYVETDYVNITVQYAVSELEHRWQFNMGSNPTFFIDASNPVGSDSDFTLEWSDDGGGSWNGFSTPIVYTPGEENVSKSSPMALATYYPNFLLRAISTNQAGLNIDTFSIDRLWAEGQFNNNPEPVHATIDISTWTPGIYDLYVYGWDKTPQYNVTSTAYATLIIDDNLPPEIYNFLIEGKKTIDWNLTDGPAVLTGLMDDTNTGNSIIKGAGYTDGYQNWGVGDLMTNDTALDSPVETFSRSVDFWNWTVGPHTLFMYGSDKSGMINETSTENITVNVIDNVAPYTDDWSATLNGAFQIWVDPAVTSQVYLNATVSDAERGYSVIGNANWTAGPANWTGNWMTPADGIYDNYTEDVTTIIDISTWPTGTYYIYVYGTDVWNNGQDLTATYAILNIDGTGPAIIGPWADGQRPVLWKNGGTFELTAYGDDRNTGGSIVLKAEYFIDWVGADGTGIPMSPIGFRFDSPYEGAKALVDFSGWSNGEYHRYYVHFMDKLGRWGAMDSVIVMKRSEFAIPVQAGWNLISLPLVQGENDILKALDDNGGSTTWDRAMWYDASDITQTIAVTNELVFGPAAGGETGPFNLAYTTINDISLYNDMEGLWLLGEDYTFDWTTGTIDISAGATHLNAGESLIAFYNYTKPGDSWKTYDKNRPGAFNDLLTIDHSIGFWINITALGDGYLNITGAKPGPTSIDLVTGWNMVGYTALNDANYTVGDLKINTGATSVEGFNSSSPYNIQVLPDSYVLKRGEGYWIYSNTATSWLINW